MEMALSRERRPAIPGRGAPELASDTHGSVVAGVAGTAAGETVIGTITFPAGGPWKIWGFWGFMVCVTPTAEIGRAHV